MNTKFDIQKAPRAFRTISEVARELNLQPYVIRFWESQFKQIKPMRRKGGRRYYRPRDIDFLKGLKALLHGENITIKKVKETIIKRGKEFIVNWPDEIPVEPSVIGKQRLEIKFSHARKKTLYIKSSINEQQRLKINSLIEALNRLRKQMLANTSI